MPASIASTSSRESARAMSIPDTSPTKLGCSRRMRIAMTRLLLDRICALLFLRLDAPGGNRHSTHTFENASSASRSITDTAKKTTLLTIISDHVRLHHGKHPRIEIQGNLPRGPAAREA